jgi:hypothetical protein
MSIKARKRKHAAALRRTAPSVAAIQPDLGHVMQVAEGSRLVDRILEARLACQTIKPTMT